MGTNSRLLSPIANRTTKTITAGDSIMIHPHLLFIFGPHPFLTCLPYGADTKNRRTNIATPINPDTFRG